MLLKRNFLDCGTGKVVTIVPVVVVGHVPLPGTGTYYVLEVTFTVHVGSRYHVKSTLFVVNGIGRAQSGMVDRTQPIPTDPQSPLGSVVLWTQYHHNLNIIHG